MAVSEPLGVLAFQRFHKKKSKPKSKKQVIDSYNCAGCLTTFSGIPTTSPLTNL